MLDFPRFAIHTIIFILLLTMFLIFTLSSCSREWNFTCIAKHLCNIGCQLWVPAKFFNCQCKIPWALVFPELGRKLIFDFLRGEAQLAVQGQFLSERLNQHVITCVMEALATLHRYKIYWQQRDNVTPHLAPWIQIISVKSFRGYWFILFLERSSKIFPGFNRKMRRV